jgi:Ca2+-binding EF-hand superfamily protein
MKYAIAFAAVAALATSVAFAGERSGKGMDAKDWDAKIESHFKEVDADADGQVTEAELVAYMTAKAKSDFAAMSGGDGAVTLDEAKAHHKAKHEAMMKEHDGHKKMEHGDHKTGDQ